MSKCGEDVRWFSETLDRCAILPTAPSSTKHSGQAKVIERAFEHLRLTKVKMPPGLLKGLEHCRRAIALERAALEAGIELKRDVLATQCGAKVAHLVKASKLLDRLMPTHTELNLAFCASQVIDGPTERIIEMAHELLEQRNASLKAQHRPVTASRAASAAALSAAARQADCDFDEKRLAQIAGVSVRDMRKIDELHAALPSLKSVPRRRITSRAVKAARSALHAATLKPKRTAIHPELDYDELSPRVEAPVAASISPFDDWARDQLTAHFDTTELPQLTNAAHIRLAFNYALKALPQRAHRDHTTPTASRRPLKRTRIS